jgi:hypothetical protein
MANTFGSSSHRSMRSAVAVRLVSRRPRSRCQRCGPRPNMEQQRRVTTKTKRVSSELDVMLGDRLRSHVLDSEGSSHVSHALCLCL